MTNVSSRPKSEEKGATMLLALLLKQAMLRLLPLRRRLPNWPTPLSEAELDLPATIRLPFESEQEEDLTPSWRALRDRQAYRAAWQRRLAERSGRADRQVQRRQGA
jgi:hypothetical protein